MKTVDRADAQKALMDGKRLKMQNWGNGKWVHRRENGIIVTENGEESPLSPLYCVSTVWIILPGHGEWCTGEEWVALGGEWDRFIERWVELHDDGEAARCLSCGGDMIAWHDIPGQDREPHISAQVRKDFFSLKLTDEGDLPPVPAPEPEPACGEKDYEIMRLRKLLDCRAGRLLLRGKEFIVVSCTEPYYATVYRMIRAQEKHQGTWTEDDEAIYRSCMERFVNHAVSEWEGNTIGGEE
jgi:hypothetical protein